jgi:hypothetical protein
VTTARADPEFHAVRYAFDAAFGRFRQASDDDSWMAELSNMLHHLYRLRELCKARLSGLEQQIEPQTPALRPERGATRARNCDTHRLFRLASGQQAQAYAETYGAVYGELLWPARIELPLARDSHGRYLDYETELEGKAIPDTLRRGFEALAALL